MGWSAGGNRSARGGFAAAFTLLEILLALALIGLLSASLITAGTHLVNSRAKTPTEIFWEASRTARRTALKTQTEVRLRYDSQEKRFVVANGGAEQTFAVEGPRELTIDFLPAQSTGGSLLIGGVLVESQTLDAVTVLS